MKVIKIKVEQFNGASEVLVVESCSCRDRELHYPLNRPSSCPNCDNRLLGDKLYGVSPEERIKYHLEPQE